jgi:hypothetical protein
MAAMSDRAISMDTMVFMGASPLRNAGNRVVAHWRGEIRVWTVLRCSVGHSHRVGCRRGRRLFVIFIDRCRVCFHSHRVKMLRPKIDRGAVDFNGCRVA